MTYNKKTIEDIAVAGKKVIARCDFNVPMKDGKIADDKRIVGALPTIKYLLAEGAAVILSLTSAAPTTSSMPSLSLTRRRRRRSRLFPRRSARPLLPSILRLPRTTTSSSLSLP